MGNKDKIIYTIGHSTHSSETFLEMLQSFKIRLLVDIRSLPGSRKFPQFDKESLEKVLPENGIDYLLMKDLGGRRKVNKGSKNTAWQNTSFRAYADYMETEPFENAIKELEQIAIEKTTAYMCAEAVWWRCHRSMVSDVLKNEGWKVLHIMGIGKAEEHRFTAPARILDGKVVYTEETV